MLYCCLYILVFPHNICLKLSFWTKKSKDVAEEGDFVVVHNICGSFKTVFLRAPHQDTSLSVYISSLKYICLNLSGLNSR